MPQTVFGPEPRGKTGETVKKFLNDNNKIFERGLDRAQLMQVRQGGETCYIYNVSPIFGWEKNYPMLGAIVIRKREAGKKVSDPTLIPGFIVRSYDAGGKIQKMVEVGKDIAEDVLGCSEEYPTVARNNLTNYGCFFTIGLALEELPKEEQEKLTREAEASHIKICRDKVLEADQWYSSQHASWINEIHRLCFLFVKEKGETRNWAAERGAQPNTEECKWCGYLNKRGIAICANCKNVVSQELFDALSKKTGKKAHPSP